MIRFYNSWNKKSKKTGSVKYSNNTRRRENVNKSRKTTSSNKLSVRKTTKRTRTVRAANSRSTKR